MRKLCSGCGSRGEEEEEEVSHCHTACQTAMETAPGVFKGTQDRDEEHQTRGLGSSAPPKYRVGQSCAQIYVLTDLE